MTLNKRVPILTTPQAAKALKSLGFKATRGLKTWKTARFQNGGNSLEVSALPGKHGPGLVSYGLSQVMGTLPDLRDADEGRLRIYVTGDTLMHDRSCIWVGNRVLGLMVTMDAEQGVKMLRGGAPKTAVPIHYDDYDRSKSPLSDFARAVEAVGLSDRVHYLQRGERMALRLRP